MSSSSQAAMRKIYRQLQRQGFTVTRTNGGHARIEHPRMLGPVFAPGTPSDVRGVKNFKAKLKRKMRRELVDG